MRITDVPLLTTIDPSSVTTALHSLLFQLILTIQMKVTSRGDEELSIIADNLIQKFREMDTLVSQKEEVVVQEEARVRPIPRAAPPTLAPLTCSYQRASLCLL